MLGVMVMNDAIARRSVAESQLEAGIFKTKRFGPLLRPLLEPACMSPHLPHQSVKTCTDHTTPSRLCFR